MRSNGGESRVCSPGGGTAGKCRRGGAPVTRGSKIDDDGDAVVLRARGGHDETQRDMANPMVATACSGTVSAAGGVRFGGGTPPATSCLHGAALLLRQKIKERHQRARKDAGVRMDLKGVAGTH